MEFGHPPLDAHLYHASFGMIVVRTIDDGTTGMMKEEKFSPIDAPNLKPAPTLIEKGKSYLNTPSRPPFKNAINTRVWLGRCSGQIK